MASTPSKFRKSHKILIALAGLAILVGLAFSLPNFVSDGTEKFVGKEAKYAKNTIAGDYVDPPSSTLGLTL